MAEEDEIDVLGDFSFNSCLAQNNQGIPSCSSREDTVHPEWLLDSTRTNWYDSKSYKLSTQSRLRRTSWTNSERAILRQEMCKYGRDIKKISQSITTKSEPEILALIEAEFGINLDTPSLGLNNDGASLDHDDIPAVVQEEIVTDDDTPSDLNEVMSLVSTGLPTVTTLTRKPKSVYRKKNVNPKSKNSLLKPDVLIEIKNSNPSILNINPTILYEDDLVVASVESVESTNNEGLALNSKTTLKQLRTTEKVLKKIGNHRRKKFSNACINPPAVKPKSPMKPKVNDTSVLKDGSATPKLQIVLGSGQAVPISDGEQVIKIEKKKGSESESDIEIDVDSEEESVGPTTLAQAEKVQRLKTVGDVAVLQHRKFEPMPKRHKKIALDGGGGYTIMHTEAGDLYERGTEPRKEKPPKKQQIDLLQCRVFNAERPAPYEVLMHVSALVCMDVQAHASRGEVMGLAGGWLHGRTVTVAAYRAAAAAASRMHCDMCPVSQARAAESLQGMGMSVVGWHHSHPSFPASPSRLDLRTQHALQVALERPGAPLLGLITSQHWATGRSASHYKCIRVELNADGTEVSYQFSVKLQPDLTEDNLVCFLQQLREMVHDDTITNDMPVDVFNDVCPEAGTTFIDKCISSVSHHLLSAGYSEDVAVTKELLVGIRDIFR